MTRERFSYRALTAFLLLWAFGSLLSSGIVLYVAPPGRIANWTDWRLLGLTKGQWQAIHTVLGFGFVLAGLFHVFKFNWRVLRNYLRKRAAKGPRYRRELLVSVILAAVFLIGSGLELPPFAQIVALGDYAKNSWAAPEEEPPVPHTELKTLAEVARQLNLSPDEALQELRARGLSVRGADVTLLQIARENGVSAREVYEMLTGSFHPSQPQIAGSGLGRKTLAELARQVGLSPEDAVVMLGQLGVEASPEETIRQIAQRMGVRPYEIAEWLAENERAGGQAAAPQR